jgi:hypothetical protein
VLVLKLIDDCLNLVIVSPSGRSMTAVIADDKMVIGSKLQGYEDGQVYVVQPQAGRFIGPVLVPEYLSHITGMVSHSELAALESLRGRGQTLPPKGVS